MKTSKTSKASTFFRYEFSDESGRREGGDIFEFATLAEVQSMTAEILKVAQSDKVAVNLTIGGEGPFFGFLKNVGMSRKDAEKEFVDRDLAPVAAGKAPGANKAGKKTGAKKTPAKKSAKAAAAKDSKKNRKAKK